MSYILGIDIGTGSTKAVAVDVNGKVLYSDQCFYGLLPKTEPLHEQEPDIIFKAFQQVIRSSVQKMGEQPLAVSLSSAMHSLMIMDKEKKPCSNLLIWSDGRSAGIAEKLRSMSEAPGIYERTGTPIHAMSPLCKIIWFREQMPSLFEKADKFISIKEYIWLRLFDEYVIDHSLASATGLFDI